MAMQKTPGELAEVILGMTYTDFIGVCADLAAMMEEKDVRPKLKTADQFASLLHDWADAQDAGGQNG